jgi:hypothetical protein
MTDPFMMPKGPSFTWQRIASALLFIGITALLLRWPSNGPLGSRLAYGVFFGGLAGAITIWFPDDAEDYEGTLRGESLIDKVRPLKFECSIGWLYLLGPFVVWLIAKLV